MSNNFWVPSYAIQAPHSRDYCNCVMHMNVRIARARAWAMARAAQLGHARAVRTRVLDLCPSRRSWCMVLWWDGSWQRKHRSYSQWRYATIVATVHCARICYDLFSQKVSSLGSCISWKRGAEYCQILRHRSDESASISLNYEQEGNSITTCRQTLHHSGCNVFQWKPLVLTPKQLHVPSCCSELIGLQTEYYLVWDKKGEVREPYVTGYMLPYGENSWKKWLRHLKWLWIHNMHW